VELRATDRAIANLGIPITTRKNKQGEKSYEKDSVNESVTQVLRGVSGFINYITSGRQNGIEIKKDRKQIIIPVVFTTAQLLITDADIATADLVTGKLPENQIKAKKTDWIWYNYNRSTEITHGLQMVGTASQGYSNLFREFTRTVAIVGPDGLDSFIRHNFNSTYW